MYVYNVLPETDKSIKRIQGRFTIRFTLYLVLQQSWHCFNIGLYFIVFASQYCLTFIKDGTFKRQYVFKSDVTVEILKILYALRSYLNFTFMTLVFVLKFDKNNIKLFIG